METKPETSTQASHQKSHKKFQEIFVGGLPSYTTAPLLKKYFSQFGKILKAQPQRWKSGARKCRGFAIIRCGNRSTFESILSTPHSFEGRVIECKPSLNKKQLLRYNKNLSERKVFIGGIPKNMTSQQLQELFSRVGDLEMAYVVQRRDGRGNKGIGFVTFKAKIDCKKAVEIREFLYQGKEILCLQYENKNFEEKKKANPGISKNKKWRKYKGENSFYSRKESLGNSAGYAKKEMREEEDTHANTTERENKYGMTREERRKRLIAIFEKKAKNCSSDSNPEAFFEFLTPVCKRWTRLFKTRRIDNSFKGQNYRFNPPSL